MRFLNLDRACTILRLKNTDVSGNSLLDQIQPIIEHVPHVILDMGSIRITSMAIGELTNVAREFKRCWEHKPHSLAMTNLDAAGRKSLAVIHFDQVIPIIDDQQGYLDLLFGVAQRNSEAV